MNKQPKLRISSSIDKDLADSIKKEMKKEKRLFSPMVAILLEEAINNRNKK